MAEKYGVLKGLSNEQLIDRYNEQAHYTGASADFYLEELRHRELCRLLEAYRGDRSWTGNVESCLEMIELLSEWLQRVIESSPSIPLEMRRNTTRARDQAELFVDSMRQNSGLSRPRLPSPEK